MLPSCRLYTRVLGFREPISEGFLHGGSTSFTNLGACQMGFEIFGLWFHLFLRLLSQFPVFILLLLLFSLSLPSVVTFSPSILILLLPFCRHFLTLLIFSHSFTFYPYSLPSTLTLFLEYPSLSPSSSLLYLLLSHSSLCAHTPLIHILSTSLPHLLLSHSSLYAHTPLTPSPSPLSPTLTSFPHSLLPDRPQSTRVPCPLFTQLTRTIHSGTSFPTRVQHQPTGFSSLLTSFIASSFRE